MSIVLVMPSNHLILCHPLLLLPSIFPSIMVFSNESALCIRWPKYWNFIFSISPSNEHLELISVRMDWLDFLAVQATLKSLLQHHMANRWGNSGNSVRFYFFGSQTTADGDFSHEIKKHLLFGRKVMTNLDSIFKSRDITLPTQVPLVKAMAFPVVMYGCESWTVKKAEH